MLLRVKKNLPSINSPGRQALGLDPLRVQAKFRAHFPVSIIPKEEKRKILAKDAVPKVYKAKQSGLLTLPSRA